MTSGRMRWTSRTVAVLLQFALLCSPLISQQEDYKFRVQSEMVLVNVTVRDKSGNIVTNLKPEDFTVLEDNKPQKVVSFDIENVDAVAMQSVAQAHSIPESSQPANPADTNTSSTNA